MSEKIEEIKKDYDLEFYVLNQIKFLERYIDEKYDSDGESVRKLYDGLFFIKSSISKKIGQDVINYITKEKTKEKTCLKSL